MIENKQVVILLSVLFIISCNSLHGFQKPKKAIKPWSINLSLSSFYDNNILKNSDKYLDKFKNNEDNGRFHIKKYDDLVMEYDLRFSYKHQFIKKLNSILYAEAGHNSYSYNSEKTWSQVSFGLQQYIANPTSIMLSYTYLPEFYVKHYRDADWVELYGITPETFKPFAFSKSDFSFWLQQDINSSLRARVYFSYMKYFYNEHFTEYDSDNIMYGARLFHALGKKLSVDYGYRFITSDAKGFDQPGEDKLSSNDVDGSYGEHIAFAGLDYQLPEFLELPNSIGLSGQYSYRDYSSEKSPADDPIHAGRTDNYYRFIINYKLSLLKNISLTAFFSRSWRDADTGFELNRMELSNEKDYSQNIFGLTFNYNFNF